MVLVTALAGLSAPAASAEGGGFFELESFNNHASVSASSSGGHVLHFVAPGLSSEVGCSTGLNGTTTAATIESLALTPAFANCTVTGTVSKVTIDTNGCSFTFTSAKGTTNETEQTVHLACPIGQNMVITRPDCTIVLPPQTFTGVTYASATNFSKPALTVSFNSQMVFRYEAGTCTSLGTNQTGTLKGSLTLKATDQVGNPAGVDVSWNEELGHFVSGVEHPTITGTENAEDSLHFSADPLGGGMTCKKSTYTLTSSSETAQVTIVAPLNQECTTTETGQEAGVAFNECVYRFDVLAGSTSETEQKVDFVCPAGKWALVMYAGCFMAIPSQNDIGKVTYTTVEEGGDHAITLDVNAEFIVHTFASPCTSLGTTLTGTLKGSVLVKAFATAGEQVDLTAT